MDLQTSLICVAVFAVSAIGVYLISVLGMREKTYEEAIAEQRQKGEDMLLLKKAADSSKPAKDRKHKKWPRKSKEKTDKGGEPEGELHVGFKPEAEIIPDEKEAEARKSGKGRKADEPKSILIHKKEKERTPPAPAKAPKRQGSNDSADGAAESRPAEKEPSPAKKEEKRAEPKERRDPADEPKAEGEKKRDGSSEKEVPQKERSKERDESKPKEARKEEVAAASQASPARKAKKNRIDDEALNSARLASLIKAAVLSQTEIQSLIEALLNKQQAEPGGTEWLKIGQKMDPVSALRKQLQEKEEMLAEERQRAQTTGAKLKDLRQELNGEKARYGQAERQSQQEAQNLRVQVQRATAESGNLQGKLQQAQAQLTEESSAALKFKEENSQLCLTLSQLETKNSSLQVQVEELQASVNDISIQKQQLEEHAQSLEGEENSYKQRASDLESQARAFDGEKAALVARLQDLGSTFEAAEAEKAQLQQRLAELQSELALHEASQKQASDLAEDLKQQKSGLEKQVSALQVTLSTHDASQKQLNDLIEDLKREKGVLEKESAATHAHLQEILKKLAKCDNEITAIKEENELLASQLSKVTEREEAEGQEGTGETLPRDKTNGHVQLEECGDHKKIPLTEHEHILHEKENLVHQLTADLKDKTAEIQTLLKQVADHKETIARLTADVEAQKDKNNALREKNWKVMEALNKAEKAQNDGVKQAENVANEKFLERLKAEQKLSRDVLERIFPAIRIESAEFSEWMSQFEKHAKSSVAEALAAKQAGGEDELKRKLEASEDSCNKLQAQVQHYKTSLVETEGILKKIQGSVEEEELKWKEKLEAKEQQLEKLLQEKKSYEASLEQVKAAEEAAADMQGKLRELQEKLQAEETERRSLDGRRLEVEKVASGLRDQLKLSEDQLQQWKLEMEAISQQSKEADVLRQELEKERQSYKEMNAQNVKLNSLVKIGQDALRAEQDLVKSLQLKLESNKGEQVPATNGPPPDSQTPAIEVASVKK